MPSVAMCGSAGAMRGSARECGAMRRHAWECGAMRLLVVPTAYGNSLSKDRQSLRIHASPVTKRE